MSILSDKDPCGWPMRRFLFLLLLSISGIPKFVNIKKIQKKIKKWPMSSQKITKKNKIKNYKNKNKMCRGGDLLYLLCLISNTLPQLEQSSLQPSTVLHHRHLLQTSSYNHLLLLHHLLISRKEKTKQQQARTSPLSRGLRSQKGLRPFNPLHNHSLLVQYLIYYCGIQCLSFQ